MHRTQQCKNPVCEMWRESGPSKCSRDPGTVPGGCAEHIVGGDVPEQRELQQSAFDQASKNTRAIDPLWQTDRQTHKDTNKRGKTRLVGIVYSAVYSNCYMYCRNE